MPPTLEVIFECLSTPVRSVTTYFAFIFDTKSMKFIEPIRNGPSIPSKGKIFRIVDWFLLF